VVGQSTYTDDNLEGSATSRINVRVARIPTGAVDLRSGIVGKHCATREAAFAHLADLALALCRTEWPTRL
jgi:hypothetical protein